MLNKGFVIIVIALALLMTALSADALASGETWQSAASLVKDHMITFTIPSKDTAIWYALTMPAADQTIELSIEKVGGGKFDGRVNIFLYDEKTLKDGKTDLLARWDGISLAETVRCKYLEAGTYYIRIFSSGLDSDVNLSSLSIKSNFGHQDAVNTPSNSNDGGAGNASETEASALEASPDLQEDGALALSKSEPLSDMPTELQQLLQKKDVLSLFGGYNFSMYYISDISFLEAASYGIKNWKETAVAIAQGNFSIEAIAERYMNNPTKVKALLKLIINRLSGTNEYTGFTDAYNTVNAIGSFNTLMDVLFDMGVAEEEIKEAKALFESGGVVQKFLTNYSKNIAMLESLKSIAPSNSFLNDIADELIYDYQTSFATDYLEKKSTKAGYKMVDWLMGSSFTSVDKVVQVALGHIPVLNGLDKVIGVSTLKASAIMSFRKTAEKIMSGNFTDADVESYILMFNICRELTIEEYEAMCTKYRTTSNEAVYLQDQLYYLRKMTYDNYTYATPYNSF